MKDLQALPEEAFKKDFGGKTRTVADIVYEVNLVNDHVGMVIRGEEPFVWPEGAAWIKAPEGFGAKDDVIAAFQKSSEKIISTVDAYSVEELEAPLQTEDGETNRAERCRFMTLHVWYHGGQLNFIQTLLGDDAWHWK
ncbi:hypothetical protein OP10G_2645 [Fimbriimonas ginsengisoli Gsoil 348]|uniref:DinB-like domain-containing protein n=1 Tax=Fimbriimonas ginsengisoli Gsoil 348 TaxID=661478 RepID=A0A068NR47_FIMGI|nr:hypothetical protein OP10G_2645 [Fimbriimonas ginsengisoli Gsoil 348]